MYLYGFNKYAGSDKVWKIDEDYIESHNKNLKPSENFYVDEIMPAGGEAENSSEAKKGQTSNADRYKSGDLLQIGDDFYLALGKDVSFFEQYVYGLKTDLNKTQIIEKKLLNKQTLELLHRMVYQRYSTYKNVAKLFLPQEVEKLMDKKIKKKSSMSDSLPDGLSEDFLLYKIKPSPIGQTLVVFPDLRTLLNITKADFREQSRVDTLLSTNTQNQKDKAWRNIKNGNTRIILSTHSEIFQNFKDLEKIIIIRPHKRYYSNQQDPRYKTLDVVQKMAEIWNCELEVID